MKRTIATKSKTSRKDARRIAKNRKLRQARSKFPFTSRTSWMV